MRMLNIFRRQAIPAVSLAALAIAAAVGTGPAQADRIRDRVHADSFGNLIVFSSSGYKRIVVGRGDLAGELKDYVGGTKVIRGGASSRAYEGKSRDYEIYEDEAYRSDGLRTDHRRRYHSNFYHHGGDDYGRGCYRPPVFVKGRSYMYGLADGEMPELAPCLPYNE